MQVWIECLELHCIEAWTTHQQARLMHGRVSKRLKMHIKPTGGTNKHGKHSIEWSEKGKGMHKATDIMVMHPKWLHPNKASWASDVTVKQQTR